MNKLYFLIVLLFTSALSFGQDAQTTAEGTVENISAFSDYDLTASAKQSDIEDLRLYPNPVTHGKVTITTAKNLSKQITVFDILGKQVLNRRLYGTVLDVSALAAGVYIIKVTENAKTVFRKLVIR